MYCPQCGTESPPALQYCRVCGANLKVIGKAVSLSEAIARSDRGPLPKLKEMVKGLNVDHVTEEVSRAFDRMNQELAEISTETKPRARHRDRRSGASHSLTRLRKKKTPAERRENHLTTGVVSLFSGVGLTIFLYYLSAAMVLKLPPHIIDQIPFEIDPVVRIIWLLGLLPMLSGVGHIFAGRLIRPRQDLELDQPVSVPRDLTEGASTTTGVPAPASVTERTTNLLEHNY
ncbi:MAG TPA: hypothetical protein VFI57_05665 [Pyrinomonadaceae bacterium]|nr:hypothetical protein [Pyrinomonadaceae bacterium]